MPGLKCLYPITYSFVIRSHQNFQSVKTAMTVAIHLLSVSNRDNIQYSEDISQVGVAMMSITKKMTRQLSQPFVLSQTRAGWGCLLLWQVPSLWRMPPPMNLTLTWNSGEISQSKKVWLGLAHLGTLYTDTNITNANFFITWTTILLNIT